MKRLLCFLLGGHFVRRTPWIIKPAAPGDLPAWMTRARCGCGLRDVVVSGLCTQAEADARARESLKRRRAWLAGDPV